MPCEHEGVTGGMVRDMMLIAFEWRFAANRTIRYAAATLRSRRSALLSESARALALRSFHARSKPSIEWHVRVVRETFKRDYLRCNPCPNEEAVRDTLDAWFEDDNELHLIRGHRIAEWIAISLVASK